MAMPMLPKPKLQFDAMAGGIIGKRKNDEPHEASSSSSSRTGPLWWSEADGQLIANMLAVVDVPENEESKYDKEPECVNWEEVTPSGMTIEEAKARWEKLSTPIPKRRTLLDILRIVQKNFNGARVTGSVLTNDQFEKVGNKRQRTIKLADLYPELPKRPSSAFFLWSELHRDELRKQNPNLMLKDIQKELGTRWKSLPEEEKALFNQQAKDNMTQYHVELERFFEENPEARAEKKLRGKSKLGKVTLTVEAPTPPQRSGYHVFLQEMRPKFPTLPFTEAVKIIAERWQALPDSDKERYKTVVDQQWSEYETQWASYLDTLPREQRDSLLRQKRSQPGSAASRKHRINKLKEPVKPTAYRCFCDANMNKFIGMHKNDVAKAQRDMWRMLDEEQRMQYRRHAELARVQYHQDYLEYDKAKKARDTVQPSRPPPVVLQPILEPARKVVWQFQINNGEFVQFSEKNNNSLTKAWRQWKQTAEDPNQMMAVNLDDHECVVDFATNTYTPYGQDRKSVV